MILTCLSTNSRWIALLVTTRLHWQKQQFYHTAHPTRKPFCFVFPLRQQFPALLSDNITETVPTDGERFVNHKEPFCNQEQKKSFEMWVVAGRQRWKRESELERRVYLEELAAGILFYIDIDIQTFPSEIPPWTRQKLYYLTKSVWLLGERKKDKPRRLKCRWRSVR